MEIKTKTATSVTGTGCPHWQLRYLDVAEREARKFLTAEQYAHVVDLFNQLANEVDPTKSEIQDVRKIEDFYELRDKGGILGKINTRVYFAVIGNRKFILALSVHKKENDGPPAEHVKVRVRHRLRKVGEMLKDGT